MQSGTEEHQRLINSALAEEAGLVDVELLPDHAHATVNGGLGAKDEQIVDVGDNEDRLAGDATRQDAIGVS